MSAPARPGRTDGCWTCKLRRKKCDELRPTCVNCDSLEIACNYGPKPAWMDGGDRQRQTAELLKNEIKRNATYRREKANTSNVAHDSNTHQFNIISDIIASKDLLSITPMDYTMSGVPASSSESNNAASHGPTPLGSQSNDHQPHNCLSGVEQNPANETDFITKYLDFVFPALFPFYRPALFETGRSWLLILLGKSKIAYHSTLSLSCYFFTMALTDAETGGEHSDCKHLRWEEVEQQTNKCFESIRADMLALNLASAGTQTTIVERVQIMQSVVQVLIFEIALGKSAPWNSHLPPAYALFEGIMNSSSPSSQTNGQPDFYSVLLSIGQPLWTKSGEKMHIWSPDQAGFRFCAGFLIFIDVVASTAIAEPPRLLKYHHEVLERVDDGNSLVMDPGIKLSSIIGCRNWVVQCIAKTSALESWKREQMKANCLSVVELVDRASEIANDLRDGIFELHNDPNVSLPSHMHHRAPFDIRPNTSPSAISTLFWAHAAQLYLTVVVSGWELSNPEIRAHVAQIIVLFQAVPSHQLRALAWPLCIAGCLALESEESSFRALLTNQGKAYTAGALDDARQILERVWQARTTLDASTWSLASCFSILGSPVLLA